MEFDDEDAEDIMEEVRHYNLEKRIQFSGIQNPYPCTTKQRTKSFLSVEELDDHVYKVALILLYELLKYLSNSTQTSDSDQTNSPVSIFSFVRRSQSNCLDQQGWAIKENRGPRMNKEV